MIAFLLTGLFTLVMLAVLALLFADELVRIVGPKAWRTHPALPEGCHYVLWSKFCDIVGGPIGGASAVTVGKTVVVHRDTWIRPVVFQNVMLHEAEHCRQRIKLGRKYLLVYIFEALKGYSKNPMEIAARKAASEATA